MHFVQIGLSTNTTFMQNLVVIEKTGVRMLPGFYSNNKAVV